ncbi:MAG: DUF3782 domain-containing protein [Candidatus Contendobacter sp.]|jgi:hypothetical protein|nr:DUF3782 domain-containing protein [Gammaproteobacteria bacterium]MCC8992318.1 DUF3782 domain-containing protein [Candidatus Contendobacter sp.]
MATTYEDVLALLGEVAKAQHEVLEAQRELVEIQKENERKAQEAQRRAEEQRLEDKRRAEEQWLEDKRRAEEAERKFQEERAENERFFKAQRQETDRRFKQVNDQLGKLGNRLGEFVEGLVKPAVVRLFRERGIEVLEFYPEVEVSRADGGIEIDLLVVNDTEAVLVEVKSKLKDSDVNDHLERLAKFKRMMPRYADVRAMGAVAAMVIPENVARYAERQGLFVLAQSGDDVVIINDAQFRPKAW